MNANVNTKKQEPEFNMVVSDTLLMYRRHFRVSLMFAVLIVSLMMFIPLLAASDASGDTTYTLNVHSSPSLSLALSGSTTSISDVAAGGQTRIASLTATTTTDNPLGYNTAISTATSDVCLRRSTDGTFCGDAQAAILPANSPDEATTLTNGQWGMALNPVFSHTDVGDDSVWYQVPPITAPKVISQASLPTDSDGTDTSLTFGARISVGTPASTSDAPYANTVTVTSIAQDGIVAPTLASISPISGPPAGGSTVTIQGSGFIVNGVVVAYDVEIGGVNCSNTVVLSSTAIACQTPSSTTGSKDVIVRTWGGTTTLTDGFTVVPPTPTITAPSANQILASDSTSVMLTVSTDLAATCYYGTSLNPDTVMSTTGSTSHNVHMSGLTDNSSNTIYVRCRTGDVFSENVSVTFFVKAGAPDINITAPNSEQILAAGTTSVGLTVSTGSNAHCYYGSAANPASLMGTTGGTAHSQSITGLTNNNAYTRYVRCQSGSGSTLSDFSDAYVTFYVRAATPATPTLSPMNGGYAYIGSTTITVSSNDAVCTWGTSSETTSNSSASTYLVVEGSVTLYYRCTAGSGNTVSTAKTGSWTFTGGVFMQGMTTANCPTAITAVKDTRDGHYYAVQKLADNRCWMLTNLAYGGTDAGTEFTTGKGQSTANCLTASASNWDSTRPPCNNQKQWLNPANTNVTIADSATRCSAAFRVSATTLDYTECGYMYNWCAALGNSNASCGITTTANVANAGLHTPCPTGWRLPTGGTGGDVDTLSKAITANKTQWYGATSKWRGLYSGFFFTGVGITGIGSRGTYWTSRSTIVESATTQFAEAINITDSSSTVAVTGYSFSRFYGGSVRCIGAT
ncbi:IPT/TIG domain-containing protein [Bifidobacterium crudilactis]|uniref:IPT/TIG domain-containing protein n=1 Tax=Bifidobacterium crudilactis TaxID=327277 RepID=UPI002F359BDF